MKLQTQIPIKKETKNLIDYRSKILLLGSCFSENIGNKLNYFKFQTQQNPFGILFQPKAIETFITNAINEKVYTEEDLVLENERWHCFDAHSTLSSSNKNEILENLNTSITSTNKHIKEASHIVITLGTSWVYRFIETDKLVANCHKIPQKKFLKEILSVDEITNSLQATIALLKAENKELNILFTVSPVRHLKDGFIENTQSKSHLISAIHNVIDKRKNINYFPSYEIMVDVLRDYRYYDGDFVHPNNLGTNSVFEYFKSLCINPKSHEKMDAFYQLSLAKKHKAMHPKTNQHKAFLKAQLKKAEKFALENPNIDFREEIKHFESKIRN